MPEGGTNNIDFNEDPARKSDLPDFNQININATPDLNDEPDFC